MGKLLRPITASCDAALAQAQEKRGRKKKKRKEKKKEVRPGFSSPYGAGRRCLQQASARSRSANKERQRGKAGKEKKKGRKGDSN